VGIGGDGGAVIPIFPFTNGEVLPFSRGDEGESGRVDELSFCLIVL
jgi:hypothetical protein